MYTSLMSTVKALRLFTNQQFPEQHRLHNKLSICRFPGSKMTRAMLIELNLDKESWLQEGDE